MLPGFIGGRDSHRPGGQKTKSATQAPPERSPPMTILASNIDLMICPELEFRNVDLILGTHTDDITHSLAVLVHPDDGNGLPWQTPLSVSLNRIGRYPSHGCIFVAAFKQLAGLPMALANAGLAATITCCEPHRGIDIVQIRLIPDNQQAAAELGYTGPLRTA